MNIDKKQDMQELKIVRRVLIESSAQVYRNLEFFYQAENIEQRREIYNRNETLEKGKTYAIVCKTFCEMIKKKLIEDYQINVETITCDSDEFGHVDILVTTKSGNKYIINCLSDLERIQMNMSSKRFASEKYYLERYANLDNISFLTKEELKEIDEELGYYQGIYMDEIIDMLADEYAQIRDILKENRDLRETLLGENYTEEMVDSLNDNDITNAKLNFLCEFFNDRRGIIGHIELVRIYKYFYRKLFDFNEQKNIKLYNAFFDSNREEDEEIFNTQNNRVRFLVIQTADTVILLSTVSNVYKKINIEEWNEFQKERNVKVVPIATSKETISETLRNKGIAVNIMKHEIVKRRLRQWDERILGTLSEQETTNFLAEIEKQGNTVRFGDKEGNQYEIELGENYIIIKENNTQTLYYYENGILVAKNNDENPKGYTWKDEGEYEEHEM